MEITQALYDQMPTKASQEALNSRERVEAIEKENPHVDGNSWQPYCCVENCSSGLARMVKRDYGFECRYCLNQIGWNMYRLKESPLNNKFLKENPQNGE